MQGSGHRSPAHSQSNPLLVFASYEGSGWADGEAFLMEVWSFIAQSSNSRTMSSGFWVSCGLLFSFGRLEGKVCENACLNCDDLFLRELHCCSCPPECDLARTGKHGRTYLYPPRHCAPIRTDLIELGLGDELFHDSQSPQYVPNTPVALLQP